MGIRHIEESQNTTIGVWEITESLKELQSLLPYENVKNLTSEKRKLEWFATRALLKNLNKSVRISYNNFGVPLLSNGKYISITHSKGLVAVIISNKKVGIDIEEISDKAIRLSSKFISKDNLKNLTDKKATLMWGVKETVYKWYQKGEIDFIKDIKIDSFKLKKKGTILTFFKQERLNLNYIKINNHYLVYVCK
tara:strand:+ start:114 stop:695 length:582 start_codon:yes stop_codon:yes gene_type:complete